MFILIGIISRCILLDFALTFIPCIDISIEPTMNFDAFDLHRKILDAVSARGYQQLTQVQSQVLPLAMAGKDIMACAQTGTGEKAAVALPLLYRFI